MVFDLSSISMEIISFTTDTPNATLDILFQPVANYNKNEQPIWSNFINPVHLIK